MATATAKTATTAKKAVKVTEVAEEKQEENFYNAIIPVNELNIDSGYQRAVDQKRVKRIANSWDDSQARDIYVSERNDGKTTSFWILDGQHTVAAAITVGKKELHCRVYTNLSRKQEADMYYRLNDSQIKPTTIDKFKAAKVAGYEEEIKLDALLKERGLVAARKKPREGDENIDKNLFPVTAVQQLLTALKKHGADHVNQLLDVIVEGWGKENAAFNVHILTGLSRFLHEYDQRISANKPFDMNRMVTVLRSVPPSMVMERSNKHRSVVGNRPLAVAEAFDEIYRVPNKVGVDLPTIRKRWTRRR